MEAARGDKQVKEKLKRMKTAVKTKDMEIKDFKDIVSNLKIFEVNAIKEKGKLGRSNQSLIEEKESLFNRIRELASQAHKLKLADLSQRASRKQHEETGFNVGSMDGIKYCVKNAFKKFPQVAWAELGAEGVLRLSRILRRRRLWR